MRKKRASRAFAAIIAFPARDPEPEPPPAAVRDVHESDEEDLEACEFQLLRLERALMYSSAERPGELVYLPGGLEGQDDLCVAGAEQVRLQRRAERIWTRVLALARETSDFAAVAVEAHARLLGFLPRATLVARMEALSERLREFDGQPPAAVA
jgi:hypothetical protein